MDKRVCEERRSDDRRWCQAGKTRTRSQDRDNPNRLERLFLIWPRGGDWYKKEQQRATSRRTCIRHWKAVLKISLLVSVIGK